MSEHTARLVHAARTGSATALDDLYRRAATKLLPLVHLRMGSKLRGEADTQDVVQSALLKTFKRMHQLEDAGAFMAWAWRAAENELRDRADRAASQMRDARLEEPLDEKAERLAASVRSALSQVIADEGVRRLERALSSLPEWHREVILLRKHEELSFAEIGARMGRTEDAARMLYARAMTALTNVMAGSS